MTSEPKPSTYLHFLWDSEKTDPKISFMNKDKASPFQKAVFPALATI